jgi:hypothetical protein
MTREALPAKADVVAATIATIAARAICKFFMIPPWTAVLLAREVYQDVTAVDLS